MPAYCRAQGVLLSAGSDLKSTTGFAASLLPGSRSNKKPVLLNRGLDSSTRWEQRKVGEGGGAFPKNQGSSMRGDVARHFMTSAATALSG